MSATARLLESAAKIFKANARCSFDTLDDAIAAAQVSSQGGWEPRPYYVARVSRRRLTDG